ncbi:hypothetical protein PPERSA_11956 [Pseudocohnilembus persalinus]|uniref:Tetratricopeptide repeat protein n=1 Tax=Pseudocohnilembus persalinus TaxID=266149 RepID=A0A0V0QKI9_PSEPJ|nr:hypothetical protein PPERSA_11956 [Pseudocohnilembus persalinus]|eukprot:KRX02616.1 hypothetical protein PPERSA_11956 [Pseudocohnilembus persalinus]
MGLCHSKTKPKKYSKAAPPTFSRTHPLFDSNIKVIQEASNEMEEQQYEVDLNLDIDFDEQENCEMTHNTVVNYSLQRSMMKNKQLEKTHKDVVDIQFQLFNEPSIELYLQIIQKFYTNCKYSMVMHYCQLAESIYYDSKNMNHNQKQNGSKGSTDIESNSTSYTSTELFGKNIKLQDNERFILSEIYKYWGKALIQDYQQHESIQKFQLAYEIFPQNSSVIENWIQILFELQLYVEAINIYEQQQQYQNQKKISQLYFEYGKQNYHQYEKYLNEFNELNNQSNLKEKIDDKLDLIHLISLQQKKTFYFQEATDNFIKAMKQNKRILDYSFFWTNKKMLVYKEVVYKLYKKKNYFLTLGFSISKKLQKQEINQNQQLDNFSLTEEQLQNQKINDDILNILAGQ